MQAFITWLGSFLTAFFDNLRLWAEGLIQLLTDWMVTLFVDYVYPIMDSMCDYCSADLTGAAQTAHAVISQYYPVVQWFMPLAEITGIILCYITVYFLIWPLKLVVRSLMQLL